MSLLTLGVGKTGTTGGLSFVANNSPSANNVSTPSLVGVTAGALMVLTCAAADDVAIATTVSITGTTLTWTKVVANPAGTHSGTCEIWTAPCPAGGTVSPTCTWTGGTVKSSSSVLWAFTGQEATPAGASNSAQLQTAPSVLVTTTRTNSYLLCVSSDWNAVNTAPTYRDSAVQQLLDNTHPLDYIAYHYYKIATSITGYTEGLTSPSTMSAGTDVYEIRTP